MSVKILSREPFAWTINKESLEDQLNTHYYHPVFLELIETLDKKVNSGNYEKVELGNKHLTTVSSLLGFERETFKYSEKKEVPYLRVHNIKPFFIDMEDKLVYISRNVHSELKRSSLQPDDVILTTTGTVGTAVVIPPELKECNVSQEMVRIRILDKNRLRPHYLAAYLNRSETKTLLDRWGSGSTRPRTLVKKVRKIPILIPKSIKVQDEIVKKVKDIEKSQKTLLKSFTDLQKQTDILYH